MGLHVGLVGAGRIGSVHLRSLARSPRVERVSVTDADPGRAAALAATVGADHLGSPEAVVEAGAQALVVAAATPAHVPLLRLAAAARIPCFCEKPIALDLDTLDEGLRAVEESGILLQVGFQRRFDAGYRAAREAVCSGRLGEPLLVRAASHDPTPPPEEYIAASGGLWRDMLVHDFDVVPWVIGRELVEVYADGAAHDPVFTRHGDVDAAAAVLSFEGGTLGVLTSSRIDPLGHDVRLEVFGSRDSVAVGLGERTPLHPLDGGGAIPSGEAEEASEAAPAWRGFIERFEPAYEAEIEAFLQAVAEGGGSPCGGAEARRALRVALAAELSRAEHRPVKVQEIG
jgi:myo-inositol 2-dehydrogenase/D-chiro-inositol 1-dehydrogenase